MEIIFDISSKFNVLDSQIELFVSETAYGPQTIALIPRQNSHYYIVYHLGSLPVNVETAIDLWESLNRKLTFAELEQVLSKNIISF